MADNRPSAPSSSAPATFSTFVISLASAAFIELGLIEDPATQKRRVDIPMARQNIDLLSVLQEKTRGNLSPEEKQLLEQALTDLRLQFARVSAGKSTSPEGDQK